MEDLINKPDRICVKELFEHPDGHINRVSTRGAISLITAPRYLHGWWVNRMKELNTELSKLEQTPFNYGTRNWDEWCGVKQEISAMHGLRNKIINETSYDVATDNIITHE